MSERKLAVSLTASLAVVGTLLTPVASAETTAVDDSVCTIQIRTREHENISASEKDFRKQMNEGSRTLKKSNAERMISMHRIQITGWRTMVERLEALQRNHEITDEAFSRETEPLNALIKIYEGEVIPQLEKCAMEANNGKTETAALSTADGEPNNVGVGLIASGVTLAIVGFIAAIVPQLKNVLPAQLAALLP